MNDRHPSGVGVAAARWWGRVLVDLLQSVCGNGMKYTPSSSQALPTSRTSLVSTPRSALGGL